MEALKIIWFNFPKQGLFQSKIISKFGRHPQGPAQLNLWISPPSVKIPEPLWATCSSVWPPSQENSFSSATVMYCWPMFNLLSTISYWVFSANCFPDSQPPACTGVQGNSSQGWLCLCWTSRGSHFFSLSRSIQKAAQTTGVLTAPPDSVRLVGGFHPIVQIIKKDVKPCCSQYYAATCLQLNGVLLTLEHCWAHQFRQVSVLSAHPVIHLPSLYFIGLPLKMLWETASKALLLVLHIFRMISRITCSITFPGT